MLSQVTSCIRFCIWEKAGKLCLGDYNGETKAIVRAWGDQGNFIHASWHWKNTHAHTHKSHTHTGEL